MDPCDKMQQLCYQRRVDYSPEAWKKQPGALGGAESHSSVESRGAGCEGHVGLGEETLRAVEESEGRHKGIKACRVGRISSCSGVQKYSVCEGVGSWRC